MHVIAAKAVAFREATTERFRKYQRRVLSNASALAAALQERGHRIVSGGTDNHLFLLDLTPIGLTGDVAEDRLARVGLIVNKNSIPFDPNPPMRPSGVRIGSPAVTSRGMDGEQMSVIADLVDRTLRTDERGRLDAVAHQVRELADAYPAYPDLLRELE